MPELFVAALTPVFICLFYIYIRDRYEKEPLSLLIIGVLCGAAAAAPIIQIEKIFIMNTPSYGELFEEFYLSFVAAAFIEEAFKFAVIIFLILNNKNFNERFDGIVYAVFISLGFAGVENILYVFNQEVGGFDTAAMRAVFSVPAHAIFGVFMGYHFGLYKFGRKRTGLHLLLAFLIPILIHGSYDFILSIERLYATVIFIPFMTLLWLRGLKQMKNHIEASPFRNRRLIK